MRCFGYDPYNAKDFVARWERENGPFGIEKVIQGVKTESVPLGELKTLAEQRALIFDESLMSFTMGNCITLEDTNGNRKLLKKHRDEKIDSVSARVRRPQPMRPSQTTSISPAPTPSRSRMKWIENSKEELKGETQHGRNYI